MSPVRVASAFSILTELIAVSLSLMKLSDEFVELAFTSLVFAPKPVEGFFAVTQPEMTPRSIRKTGNVFIVVTSKINRDCFTGVDSSASATDIYHNKAKSKREAKRRSTLATLRLVV